MGGNFETSEKYKPKPKAKPISNKGAAPPTVLVLPSRRSSSSSCHSPWASSHPQPFLPLSHGLSLLLQDTAAPFFPLADLHCSPYFPPLLHSPAYLQSPSALHTKISWTTLILLKRSRPPSSGDFSFPLPRPKESSRPPHWHPQIFPPPPSQAATTNRGEDGWAATASTEASHRLRLLPPDQPEHSGAHRPRSVRRLPPAPAQRRRRPTARPATGWRRKERTPRRRKKTEENRSKKGKENRSETDLNKD